MSDGTVDITMADVSRLEDVVDRQALREVCQSFFDLFRVSIRVFSAGGSLLADVHEEVELYDYLKTLAGGRRALSETVEQIARSKGDSAEQLREFTGCVYDVVPLLYHGRSIGRFVVGPYVRGDMTEVPGSLLSVDPELRPDQVVTLLSKIPRVRHETAIRIARHLRCVLDLLLFSSHRAHLTSEMHVASVREGYRELAEKTAKLQAAYDRLKELDQLKSNFLATVSHELRTPLTSIIGYSEMLEAGIAGELSQEQGEFVGTIHAKGEQLLALISSLLDISKLEQGVMKIRPERLDAVAIVDDVIRTFEPAAHKKGVALRAKVDATLLPRIDGDPLRIRQVLSNLMENALKFTPRGGIVTVGAEPADFETVGDDDPFGAALLSDSRKAVAFTIRDTGVGMPRAELPKIFDAFYQVDGSSTREHGGTGLGLAIVKRLVDAHGGRIEVDSEVGVGTVFTVTIPETET